MKEKIEYFLAHFEEITKEEADFIEAIVKWDQEKRTAFLMAKAIYESNIDS